MTAIGNCLPLFTGKGKRNELVGKYFVVDLRRLCGGDDLYIRWDIALPNHHWHSIRIANDQNWICNVHPFWQRGCRKPGGKWFASAHLQYCLGVAIRMGDCDRSLNIGFDFGTYRNWTPVRETASEVIGGLHVAFWPFFEEGVLNFADNTKAHITLSN